MFRDGWVIQFRLSFKVNLGEEITIIMSAVIKN